MTQRFEAMAVDPELAANLAAVAHLIHGSSEGRFTVTYAPGPELSRADVEGVGFNYLPLDEALERFPPAAVDIPDPGLGLWRTRALDRYIDCASDVGLELYRGVAELPIVSPHGHIDVRLLADPAARLEPPGRLFVTTDHYVVRMLYSQGVPLEQAGLGGGEVDDRDVWQVLADNVGLFALTPTGLWLRETLATVFKIEERLGPSSAVSIYDRVEEQLATPEFAPRALLDRFRVECLSTTDSAGASLEDHRALWAVACFATFRPDAVVALEPTVGAMRWPSSKGLSAVRSRAIR